MSCGLPVITTDVGGNAEVVSNKDIGTIVKFNDPEALKNAIDQALEKKWPVRKIIQYAHDNSWDNRVNILLNEFNDLLIKKQ